jgi:hypothetical protein
MTLATTPTTSITATPRFAAMCDRRWRDWRGPLVVWASGRVALINMTAIQREHREWLLTLLGRGIPIRAIRRLALDDPREPRLTLMAKAELYLENRQRRNANESHE